MKPPKRRPAATESVLRRALWGWFDMTRDERAGVLPAAPVVHSRLDGVTRAWAACGGQADRVYAETKAAWWASVGSCPVCGEAAPCACGLAGR